jgi:hypothetical protein
MDLYCHSMDDTLLPKNRRTDSVYPFANRLLIAISQLGVVGHSTARRQDCRTFCPGLEPEGRDERAVFV